MAADKRTARRRSWVYHMGQRRTEEAVAATCNPRTIGMGALSLHAAPAETSDTTNGRHNREHLMARGGVV